MIYVVGSHKTDLALSTIFVHDQRCHKAQAAFLAQNSNTLLKSLVTSALLVVTRSKKETRSY